MTVQDLPTVTVPRQAGPVDPPLAPLPPRAPARAVRTEQTATEREFLLGLVAMFVVLETFIVGALVLADRLA